jgi:aminomethyltransferase
MPVHYTSIIDEHHAVRNALGLFDISHMGQFWVTGPGAKKWLNRLLSNNLDLIGVGECQYTFLLNGHGGVIDDLIVYQPGAGEYLLVVNASKIDEDFVWMESHRDEGVELKDCSRDYAGLAIQGPKSPRLFDLFFEPRHSRPARNEIKQIECDLMDFFIANTGYTGEDGFEIFFPAEHAEEVWKRILEKGAELGIKPCGLGARDTLRLEMCYPLNGSDLSADHTPFEAGLSIFVDLTKNDFIGRDALLKQKTDGIKRRLVPFKMKEKCPPPRPHYPVYKGDRRIGEITSGTLSPTLNTGIGMAYLPAEYARINEEIEIDVRGRRFPARVEKKPLHRKSL